MTEVDDRPVYYLALVVCASVAVLAPAAMIVAMCIAFVTRRLAKESEPYNTGSPPPESEDSSDDRAIVSEEPPGRGSREEEKKKTKKARKRTMAKVCIRNAKGLRGADIGNTSDPYCVCQVLGQPRKCMTTDVIYKTLDPEWEHEGFIEGLATGEHLQFTVFDQDKLTQDDLLGRATLQYNQFHFSGFSGTLTLLDSVLTPKPTLEVTVEELPLPLTSEHPHRAFVRIVSAEGLQSSDWFGTPDPYCTCEILDKPASRYSTKVLQDELSPVWLEDFEVSEYAAGDSLHFTIFNQKESMGTAILKSSEFHPHGWDGPLQLSTKGSITVEVDIAAMSRKSKASADLDMASHEASSRAGEEVKCDWMFGDCNAIAQLNPLRWSGTISIEKAISDLQHVLEHNGDRPILVKVPAHISKGHECATIKQAIAYLVSKNPNAGNEDNLDYDYDDRPARSPPLAVEDNHSRNYSNATRSDHRSGGGQVAGLPPEDPILHQMRAIGCLDCGSPPPAMLAKEACVVKYTDIDGDKIMFKVEGGHLQYYENDTIKVADLTDLKVRGRTLHLDGTACGQWKSRRKTEIQIGEREGILGDVQQLFSHCEAQARCRSCGGSGKDFLGRPCTCSRSQVSNKTGTIPWPCTSAQASTRGLLPGKGCYSDLERQTYGVCLG